MDTMTSTKVVAGFCAAFLVFLLGKWAAEGIYHVGGHGEQAYVIDTGVVESDGGGEDDVDFAALVAEADPDKGASVFRRCQACHRVEPGENITGPTLYGVVGRATVVGDNLPILLHAGTRGRLRKCKWIFGNEQFIRGSIALLPALAVAVEL